MIKEIQYISIKDLMSNLRDHPLLEDISLDRVIRYTLQFIGKMGMPKLYQDKQVVIPIEDYRGLMPCDLISIIQCRESKSKICMRSMTDTFMPEGNSQHRCGNLETSDEMTFKTQGRVIYTSFKTGEVELSYKAIPVDEDGFPLLIDNEVFLNALEAYIKKQAFTILFDTGKINNQVLQHTEQEYAFLARQCDNEFTIPSYSEAQAITNMWNTMIPRMSDFYKGFKEEGNREFIRRH